MTFNDAKEYVEGREQYNQSGAIVPFTISFPWNACRSMQINGKQIPVKYDISIFLKDRFMDDYISKDSLTKVALYYIARQEKDHDFLTKFQRKWQTRCAVPLVEETKKILNRDYSKDGTEKILKDFTVFGNLYHTFWYESIFLDSFDYYGEIYLQEVIKRECIKISANEYNILLTPSEPSFLQQERLSLLSIAEYCRRKQSLGDTIKKENDAESAFRLSSVLHRKLLIHTEKYHWIHNDYETVEYLDAKYFYDVLREIFLDEGRYQRERRMRNDLRRVGKGKETILLKNHYGKKFINTVKFFALLGNLRDERKSYSQIATSALAKFIDLFSTRASIERNVIEHAFAWEIEGILAGDKGILKQIVLRQGCLFAILHKPMQMTEFVGESASMLQKIAKNAVDRNAKLHGKTAYLGVVHGIARLVKGKKDFSKLQEGDILIAPNTRPEYVPVMKKSSAIVTEEGGITCHAAIISRELHIPCIVGVQGILSIVKDGDLVEVNADKGVVKIIKRAEIVLKD